MNTSSPKWLYFIKLICPEKLSGFILYDSAKLSEVIFQARTMAYAITAYRERKLGTYLK